MSNHTPVRIIAEAAQGFEGDESLARLLVRAAASAKADAIKFQLVYADELATPEYPYYDLFRRLEISDEGWSGISAEATRLGLDLVFDVFGSRSVGLAKQLGVNAVKIHTTDFFNCDLVKKALRSFSTVYFSAGGITTDEIEDFLNTHQSNGAARLVLMYGFQAEPTELLNNNLRRLPALRERFKKLRLGFMDHSAGDTDEAVWLAAITLPYGVEVIEKHITLDPSLQLEDCVSALGPAEFEKFVTRIRNAEAALGHDILEPTEIECAYRRKALKKVVAAHNLSEGHTIQVGDVKLLRNNPVEGEMTLERLELVIGKQTCVSISAGNAIRKDDLK